MAIFVDRRFFFLSFHGMYLIGAEEWISQKQQLWKDGGSVFEAIFRMFMTFLKVIKKIELQTFMQNVFPLLSQTKTFFHCS